MKLGLIFAAGLLVGVAVGLLAGGFGGRDDDGMGRAGEEGRNGGSYGPGGPGAMPGGKGSRPGRRGKGGGKDGAGHSPAGAGEIMEYLKDLALADDIEEINFMEMIRYASRVTTMTEGEVMAMLDLLREEVGKVDREEGRGDNAEELHQVLGAILFARLAEVNGPEAMRMALSGEFAEMDDGWDDLEEELIMMGLTAWAGADSQGAAAWFKEAAGSDARFREILEYPEVGAAFFAAMARADGKRARELLHEVGEFAPDGAAAVARYESLEGLQNLLETTAGESREEVFAVMSERSPEEARKWLEAQGELEGRDDYVDLVAGELLEDDPAAGAEWYMQQEVSEERESQRARDIVSVWVGEDPAAAQEWLSAQPDSSQRDTAEMVMAMQLASQYRDWEGGLRWAARVGDATQRQQAVERILVRGWNGREHSLQPGVAEAARATGFEEEMDRFVERQAERR